MPKISSFQIIITFTVILASFLELMDTTVVNVALPYIMGNLGVNLGMAGWVVNAYVTANVITITMSAWLSNKFGRKKYFTYSIASFTIASVCCGASQNIESLIFFRFLQGISGGALIATAQSILIEVYPPKMLNFANALFSMGIVLGPMIGTVLGGFLTEKLSWHWVFWINIPMGVIATALSYVYINEPEEKSKVTKLDWWALLYLSLGYGCLLMVLENGERLNWFSSKYIFVSFIVAIIGIILFFWKQVYSKFPIIKLEVFKSYIFSLGVFANFLFNAMALAIFLLVPLFAENVIGMSPLQAGEITSPGPIMAFPVIFIIGLLPQNKYTLVGTFIMGIFVLCIYSYFMSHLNPYVGMTELALLSLVRGFGMPMCFITISSLSLYELRGKLMPYGTAVFNMSSKLGTALGTSLVTLFIERRRYVANNDINQTLSMYNLGVNDYYDTLYNYLLGTFYEISPELLLLFKVMKQSLMVSYLDVFYSAGFVLSVCIPVMLFMLYPHKSKIKEN